jgi:hypothetical protein
MRQRLQFHDRLAGELQRTLDWRSWRVGLAQLCRDDSQAVV